MQSFSRDPLPVDAGHLRTTAVAVAEFLSGVNEDRTSTMLTVRWVTPQLTRPAPEAKSG
jgi:hypothetical protein